MTDGRKIVARQETKRTPGEFLGDLKRLIKETLDLGTGLDGARLVELLHVVGKAFAVQPDEIAILVVFQGRFLKFLIPAKLQSIGQIPLTSATSLAARTARERKPELINHFTTVPHASVFEAVPLFDERGDPIQKIMSVPLILDGKSIAVIQVSRKSKTVATAGPDFTPQNLRDLVAFAGALAPCIPLFVPD
jgi:GAF domain-containing protein